MFGDLGVFARPVVSVPIDKGPTFPLYLLPAINIPFRRGRPRSHDPITQPKTLEKNSVPSLSSSLDSLSGNEGSDGPTGLLPLLTKIPGFGDCHDRPDRPKTRKPQSTSLHGPRISCAQPDTIRCSTCATDLAFASQIVSKGFTGRHGRAFLVAPPSTQWNPSCPDSPLNDADLTQGTKPTDLINTTVGRPESRQLVTGLHSVADIWCVVCGTKIGWKYVDASEQAQKYKIGKFILETQRVAVHRIWEDVDASSPSATEGSDSTSRRERSRGSSARSSSDTNMDSTSSRVSVESYLHDEDDDIIVFDSEDEDECDDIFAGVWDAETVAKRRRSKIVNMRKGRGA